MCAAISLHTTLRWPLRGALVIDGANITNHSTRYIVGLIPELRLDPETGIVHGSVTDATWEKVQKAKDAFDMPAL